MKNKEYHENTKLRKHEKEKQIFTRLQARNLESTEKNKILFSSFLVKFISDFSVISAVKRDFWLYGY